MIQNQNNILNSIEDKKFFEDLENIQNTNKAKPQKTNKKSIKKKKVNTNYNLSEDGQAGKSFKSVKSYILGDLDISSEECDLDSFEISSNSSQAKQTPQSNSTNKRNNS